MADEDDPRVITLLRTKGLSIRSLHEPTRGLLKAYLFRVHVEQGVSLSDLAKRIGNKTSGYTSWLCRELGVRARPFEEARLKAIREKRRKYERRPFDGTDEDKAYLLGLKHGDLTTSRPWKDVVKVSTSTTHPAMARLFDRLFGGHGHVYRYARYKKDTKTYEWNLAVILDPSFDFLTQSHEDVWAWVSTSQALKRAYLSGLLDAEGSVGIYKAKNSVAVVIAYYNTNLRLLELVRRWIRDLGFNPLAPYLDKAKGFRSPGFQIEMKKDYWRVLITRSEESKSFLGVLSLRHEEKQAKSRMARALKGSERWDAVGPRVSQLRQEIRQGRDDFVGIAKQVVELRVAKRLLTAAKAG
ncbi:MAG: LAGLIDADG family homing endonuclease [archaeon]|nr:MAG: LAGLIDADG family homing endonuclease [archaeon]